MADVLLIQPTDGFYGKSQMFLPMGLLCISSFLDQEGYKIKIIDMRADEEWEKTLLNKLKTSPPICVGITVKTGIQILDGLKASKLIKKYNKDIPVVWGGVHPSFLPEQTIINENIDFVVQGEGEYTFYELVKALQDKKRNFCDIKGLWYKEDSKPKAAPARELADLDKLVTLPYNLVDINTYAEGTKYQFEGGMFTLQSSRGCPFRCTYCYNNNFNRAKWRAMSPEKVLEQVKLAVNKYNIKGIGFVDDNFFASIKRANQILELIEKAGLGVRLWFQGARVDSLHSMSESQLQRLEKLGVEYLQIGVESGSQKVLDFIKKNMRVEQVIEFNKKLAKNTNIKPIYNFMIGFPTETEKDISLTTDLFVRLLEDNPKAILRYISYLSFYPGTEIYDLALKMGLEPPSTLEEWGNHCFFDLNRSYPWLSEKMKERIKRVVYASHGTNRKLGDFFDSRFKRLLVKIYYPVSKFRLKHNFYHFMPEARWNLIDKITDTMVGD
ncbi:MAG: radical SAM protein [Nitrospinota bacterium]